MIHIYLCLVTIYNTMGNDEYCPCQFILYGIIWGGAAIIFILFIGISVGVEQMRETIFQIITDQIQFAMYAISLYWLLYCQVWQLPLGLRSRMLSF